MSVDNNNNNNNDKHTLMCHDEGGVLHMYVRKCSGCNHQGQRLLRLNSAYPATFCALCFTSLSALPLQALAAAAGHSPAADASSPSTAIVIRSQHADNNSLPSPPRRPSLLADDLNIDVSECRQHANDRAMISDLLDLNKLEHQRHTGVCTEDLQDDSFASTLPSQCLRINDGEKHGLLKDGKNSCSQLGRENAVQNTQKAILCRPLKRSYGSWDGMQAQSSHADQRIWASMKRGVKLVALTEKDKEMMRHILSSFMLPNGQKFHELDEEMQAKLHAYFKSNCPNCPECGTNTHVRFRYFNNKDKSILLQPRYHCKNSASHMSGKAKAFSHPQAVKFMHPSSFTYSKPPRPTLTADDDGPGAAQCYPVCSNA
ncbi:hypothetical protein L7F22_069139 [Adiantum nelumboides]|nr:hypothetical protein [Adiantum nelumboides]